MNEKTKFVSLKEACIITGLHQNTLRKMCDEQKIKCYKTPSGTRRFDKRYLEEMCNTLQRNQEQSRENFIYTRVSSKKQMDDLSRQINYVQSRNPEYTTYRTLSDIGSGINFTRKGLQTILDTCLQGTIGEVVVAHRDRLSRFGFDLIKCFIIKAGGKLTVLDDDGNKSTEQELAEDLLSIIHIYSCKQMGKRSYKTKKSKNSIETKSNAEENIERMD
jgi:predicted site-specific integrase-resolvase